MISYSAVCDDCPIVGARIIVKPESFAEYDGDSYEIWCYEGPHWEEELFHKYHECTHSQQNMEMYIQVKRKMPSVSAADAPEVFLWVDYAYSLE